MWSRLFLGEAQNLGRCFVANYQPSLLSSSAAVSAEKLTSKVTRVTEYPPPTEKRDLVNYPKLTIKEVPPPVRFGFIPESWFQFFYPKTGVTGPYMFMATVGTYLFSKEIILVDHNLMHAASLIGTFLIINYKFGDKIAEFHNQMLQEKIDEVNDMQENRIENARNYVDAYEKSKNLKAVAEELTKAKKEVIYLQMEAIYRQRLNDAHKKVQKRLDCLAELQNVEKRAAVKNMVDYILRNVTTQFKPEHEKLVMQNCINDLNALAAKA